MLIIIGVQILNEVNQTLQNKKKKQQKQVELAIYQEDVILPTKWSLKNLLIKFKNQKDKNFKVTVSWNFPNLVFQKTTKLLKRTIKADGILANVVGGIFKKSVKNLLPFKIFKSFGFQIKYNDQEIKLLEMIKQMDKKQIVQEKQINQIKKDLIKIQKQLQDYQQNN